MSKMREMFVEDPPSAEIAMRLNQHHAKVCDHGRNPCYLRCGVRFERACWSEIPKVERLEWLNVVDVTK